MWARPTTSPCTCGAWLDGDDARKVVGDAMIIPVVTGWTLTVHPDGTSQVTSPDGKIIRSHSPPPRPG